MFRLLATIQSLVYPSPIAMDIFSNPKHLQLLQELLNPENDDSDTDQRESHPTKSSPEAPRPPSVIVAAPPQVSPVQPQTIEEWERQEELLNDEYLEHRLRPSHDIVYKQAVCTEDLFLQLGNKTAATASCEEMTIKISMPEETVDIAHMQLDVAADSIDLQTPKYRLKLPLVQKINPDKGKATWDAEKKQLTLVLLMERDFDFVNF